MKFKHFVVSMCLCLASILAAASAYGVTFNGSSGNGDSVVFNLNPQAKIKYGPASGTAPIWVWFEAEVSYADKITWIIEDYVDPSDQDQFDDTSLGTAYRYDYPGIFVVTLIAENAWGAAMDSAVVFVSPGMVSLNITSAPSSPVVNEDVFFSFDLFTYQKALVFDKFLWDFGDGKGSPDAEPDTKYEYPGTYLVSLTATDISGTYTVRDQMFVTVAASTADPVPDFIAAPTSGPIDTTINFVNTTVGVYDSSLWNFGDANSSVTSSSTISHKYSEAGTYTVTLTVFNTAGSFSTTKTNYVTIGTTGPPQVLIDFYGAPRSVLVGSDVYFFNNTTSSYDESLWSFGDGTGSNQENPTHKYTEAGVYSVTLQVIGSFGSVERTKTGYISVQAAGSFDAFEPLFTADPVTGKSPHVVQFNNLTGVDFMDIWWDFGDGTTSKEMNPIHTYEQPGIYTVTLRVGDNAKTKLDHICTLLPSAGDYQTPAALLLSGDQGQLGTMGAFRDSVVARSVYGTGLIGLYYKHALELTAILQADPALFAEVQDLLASCIAQFESSLDTGRFGIVMEMRPAIITVLGKIAEQAGPELSEVLIKLMKDLNSNEFFQSINQSVPAQ